MTKIRLSCPSCGKELIVPEELTGKQGTCPSCGENFPVQLPIDQAAEGPPASGDDVMNWLDEAAAREKPKVTPPRPRRRPTAPLRKTAKPQQPKPATRKPIFPVRLDHVDDMGAFFRFDSRLLYNEDFRSSFPQLCLICAARRPLSVHLIFWPAKLRAGSSAQVEAMEARQVYTLRKVSDLSGRDLLGVLNPIENLPEPYSLPFPYYVCNSCSAVGAVVTDVHPAAVGESEVCELGISSIPQAEGFVLAVCGEGSEVHAQIRRAVLSGSARPWQRLPLTVRIRIRRWYKAQEGERFLLYIPDAEFAKAEAGLAGVVLTDLKLIYHKSLAHVEIPLTEKFELTPRTAEEGTRLEIIAPNGRKVVLRTTQANVKQLQQLIMRTTT